MSKGPFEAAIADLEKSNARPEVVLEKAARLINVDLQEHIASCREEVRYRTEPTSTGFKQQWLLRWLLRKLTAPEGQVNGNATDGEKSFAFSSQAWSLFLTLTSSIPRDICLEVLQERKFYHTITQLLKRLTRSTVFDHDSNPAELSDTDIDQDRPAKKRKLSSTAYTSEVAPRPTGRLLWIMLQATCRSIELLILPHDRVSTSVHQLSSAWATGWKERAALFGSLLQTMASVADQSLLQEEQKTLANIMSTLLGLWTIGTSGSRGASDDPNRAFGSSCLMPALMTLEVLRTHRHDRIVWKANIQGLERLIALHVTLPGRALFNERYAKKWRGIEDILYFEHIKGFLTDFHKTVIDVDSIRLHITQSNIPVSNLYLLRNLLDIAIRSIPSNDIRKRRLEQTWFDVLFISLVHTLWIGIPQVTSSGIVAPGAWPGVETSYDPNLLVPVEQLVDIALLHNVRLSLPVLGHLLSAVLSLETKSPPWTLLAKLSQVDVNILLPNTGINASEDLLSRLCTRIEDGIATAEAYSVIFNGIILRLLRGFATSRNFDGFLSIWREGLENAIRMRYTVPDKSDSISTVLAWEEDKLFVEFGELVRLYSPPSLGSKLLELVAEPVQLLSKKHGSTAAEFANVAIFSAFLKASILGTKKSLLSDDKSRLLLEAVTSALERQSDYQSQRWRLWSFLRELQQLQLKSELLNIIEESLTPRYGFVTLESCSAHESNKPKEKLTCKYLECFQCFSIVLEGSFHSAVHRRTLEKEITYLSKLVREVSSQSDQQAYETWNGRTQDCNSKARLLIACLAKLLQHPQIFSDEGSLFVDLLCSALKVLTVTKRQVPRPTKPSSLEALLKAMIMTEEVMENPTLRDIILDYFTHNASISLVTGTASSSLFRQIPLDLFQKPRIKVLAADMMRILEKSIGNISIEDVNDQLAIILDMESIFPGSAITTKAWRSWVGISKTLLKQTNSKSPTSRLISRTLLSRILSRLSFQAKTSKDLANVSDMFSWILTTLEENKGNDFNSLPFIPLEVFATRTIGPAGQLNEHISAEKARKARNAFARIIRKSFEKVLDERLDENHLVDVMNLLEATTSLGATGETDGIATQLARLDALIHSRQIVLEQDGSPLPQDRLLLSIERASHQLQTRSDLAITTDTIKRTLEQLSSSTDSGTAWTTEDFALLAGRVNLALEHFDGLANATALRLLREGLGNGSPLFTPIAAAVIIFHVKESDLVEYPELAQQLADFACLAALPKDCSAEQLLLSLDNTKCLLEFHPNIINQTTLDQLLSSLYVLTSASDEMTSRAPNTTQASAAAIYERVCQVIGAILSRHRRRTSDRYHLLVPVLQQLLHSLFWPGIKTLKTSSAMNAVNSLTMFGNSIPFWLRDAPDALPPSSAEQLSRLLSSICNPTVSAARSSKKRGFNELNDDTKRARQLAGQHMQYLVTEYARCSLDGQIEPSVKESLMPGMYSIMDAMEQDLIKALNAGMDASSRAIFKVLYSSWSRHGKWDHS